MSPAHSTTPGGGKPERKSFLSGKTRLRLRRRRHITRLFLFFIPILEGRLHAYRLVRIICSHTSTLYYILYKRIRNNNNFIPKRRVYVGPSPPVTGLHTWSPPLRYYYYHYILYTRSACNCVRSGTGWLLDRARRSYLNYLHWLFENIRVENENMNNLTKWFMR